MKTKSPHHPRTGPRGEEGGTGLGFHTGGLLYAGIDVSKGRLDVALRPTGGSFGVAHDHAGIGELVGQLKEAHLAVVVLEATGGLSVP